MRLSYIRPYEVLFVESKIIKNRENTVKNQITFRMSFNININNQFKLSDEFNP